MQLLHFLYIYCFPGDDIHIDTHTHTHTQASYLSLFVVPVEGSEGGGGVDDP